MLKYNLLFCPCSYYIAGGTFFYPVVWPLFYQPGCREHLKICCWMTLPRCWPGLAPLSPLQFRRRLPAAGGLNPQAATDSTCCSTSDVDLWSRSLCSVECRWEKLAKTADRKCHASNLLSSYLFFFLQTWFVWGTAWGGGKKKSSPASLLFEPSTVTELTYLLTICLWPFAGEVCFDVFAARVGWFHLCACVTKSCSEPLTCERQPLISSSWKVTPTA